MAMGRGRREVESRVYKHYSLRNRFRCHDLGAIWLRGRAQLVRFDIKESTGERGGVTAFIYCTQVTEGPLVEIWTRLKNRWRVYGTPYMLEDGYTVHKKEAASAARKTNSNLSITLLIPLT
ncbi:hypothetical protein I204_08537 [Kwoniella mangroviensis CBS 8886]|nr:hypothetical protein I204_08537 [Kwoniella mangroviensis CBS 8886]